MRRAPGGERPRHERVNLILFEPDEIGGVLLRSDRRAKHVLQVLRRQPGETFDAGVINGARGRATLRAVTPTTIEVSFAATTAAPPLSPITVIVGLPRPQTARDILRDATTVGVGGLHFVATEKGERSYGQSTLWTAGEWRRHAITGAEQAFDTRLPEVTHGRQLRDVLASLPASGQRLALDNYESARPLAEVSLFGAASVTLALGAERGWSAAERDELRTTGFQLVHLGTRVLRTETAVIAALTLVRAALRLP